MVRADEKIKLVVEYSDGLELVEALRPVLAAHRYVMAPASSLADKQEIERLHEG